MMVNTCQTSKVQPARHLLGTKPSFSNAIDKQVPQPSMKKGGCFPVFQHHQQSIWAIYLAKL